MPVVLCCCCCCHIYMPQTLLSADLGPTSLTFGVFYSSIFELVSPSSTPHLYLYTWSLAALIVPHMTGFYHR